MLCVKLRTERSGIVPKRVVGNLDTSRGPDPPGELVQFFDRKIFTVARSGDALDVAAKIPNLVKGIPSGQLEIYMIDNSGNFHSDMKNVLLGMSERDGIADFRMGP